MIGNNVHGMTVDLNGSLTVWGPGLTLYLDLTTTEREALALDLLDYNEKQREAETRRAEI